MDNFLNLFEKEKPIIGMLHLGRRATYGEALNLTKYEIDTYLNNGISGVIVEDYFGDLADVKQTLEYLYQFRNDIIYGVNYLKDYKTAFALAETFKAKFVQIDSVCGHLPVAQDTRYAEELNSLRYKTGILVIGGVRFKYQPYLSERSLEEDLQLGMQRCDGIVVTGAGTGLETPIDKVKEFKHIMNEYPLIIGAGLTLSNCIESLSIADAAIVGSYIKNNHQDDGIVSAAYVKKLINKIDTIRK